MLLLVFFRNNSRKEAEGGSEREGETLLSLCTNWSFGGRSLGAQRAAECSPERARSSRSVRLSADTSLREPRHLRRTRPAGTGREVRVISSVRARVEPQPSDVTDAMLQPPSPVQAVRRWPAPAAHRQVSALTGWRGSVRDSGVNGVIRQSKRRGRGALFL